MGSRFKLFCSALFILFLLNGCFTGWSKKDKAKFAAFGTLQAVDALQFDKDDEANPLFKNGEAMIITKIIGTGIIYLIVDRYPKERGTLLNIGNTLMTGVVVWNFSQ